MELVKNKVYLRRYGNKGDKMNKKIVLIIGTILLLLDQIIKCIVINNNFVLIPGFLNLTYTENTGIAFGLNENNVILIILVNIVILGIIIKFLKENMDKIDMLEFISLILVLVGGVGNLIDRIFRGHVIDFININLFNFPVFNMADTYITVGAIILLIVIIKQFFIKNESK